MAGVVDILRYILELDAGKFKEQAGQADSAATALGESLAGKLVGGIISAGIVFKTLQYEVQAVQAAFNYLFQSTLTAARTEVLGTVLNVVSDATKNSRIEIAREIEAIKALGITTQESRQTLIRFMQSQLDVRDAAKLARVAQDLAVISGENSSQTLNTITQAIVSQEPRLLRQYGIVQDLNDIYSKYAEQLGKVSDGLSEQEKKQALINVILDQGARVAGSYEAAMGDVGKQITSLPRLFEELANAVGDKFTPAMSDAVKVLMDFLKIARETLTTDFTLQMENLIKRQGDINASIDNVSRLVYQYNELGRAIDRINVQTVELLDIEEKIRKLAPDLYFAIQRQGEAYSISDDALQKWVKSQRSLSEVMEGDVRSTLRNSIADWKENARISTQGVDAFTEALSKLRQTYKSGGSGIPYIEYKRQEDILKETIKYYEEMGKAAERGLGKARAELLKTFDLTLPEMAGDIEISPGFDLSTGLLAELNSADFESSLKLIEQRSQIKIHFGLEVSTAQKVTNEINGLISRTKTLWGPQGLFPDATRYKAEIEKIAEQFKSVPDGLKGGLIEALKALIPKAKETADQIASAFGYAASSFFSLFDEGIARIVSDLGNAISGAISGFSKGGVAGFASAFGSVISGLASIFSSSDDSNQRLIVSQRDLIDAIKSWQTTVETLSQPEKQAQVTGAQRILDILNRGRPLQAFDRSQIRDIAEAAGLTIPEGLTDTQLREWAESIVRGINVSDAQTRRILTADTKESRIAAVKGSKDATEAINTVRDLTAMYNLTPEEQKALWEEVSRDFPKMSNMQLIEINTSIKQLDRDIASGKDTGAAAEQTQVSRSIQKVTERQADSLISALSTIDLHLQDGIMRLIDAIRNITMGFTISAAATMEVAIINAQTMNVGYMNVARSNVGGGTNANTKQLLTVESRSLGKRI